LLLSGLGYTATFYASEIVALVAVVIALQIKIPQHTPLPAGEGGFTSVLRNRNLVTASILLIVMMMPQGLMHSFFPLYAIDQGVGFIGIGLFFTVYALSMGGVRPIIGVLSDRIGRVAVIVPFALISGLGVASFAVLGDLAGFMVIGAMLGAGMGAAQSTLSALSVDTIKPRLRGQAVAVGGTFTVLGISLGSMSMGPILLAGGYSATFIVTGAAIFIGLAVFLIVRAVWKKKEKVYT
jgi:MFS family permease